MKDNYEINYIRGLLDRYYRGETSPEEETILEDFFSDADESDLPEDIASNKKLFTLTKGAHPSIEECEIPNNLIDKLNEIVEHQPISAEKQPKRFTRFMRFSVATVAASIALAVIMLCTLHDEKELPSVRECSAEVSVSASSDPDIPVLAETTEPEKEESEAGHCHNGAKPLATLQSGEAEEDGFIEITDPEEAQRIMLEIGKLLAHNVAETNSAIDDITRSLESYKEISKTILQ